MQRSIYVNIAVNDVEASKKFYTSLGALFKPAFSSPQGACMTFSDSINIMILDQAFFKGFIPSSKTLADSSKVTETLLCITVDKRQDVDIVVERAEAEGGKKDPTKMPEIPGMYSRSLEDLDGHVWEFSWMGAMAGL